MPKTPTIVLDKPEQSKRITLAKEGEALLRIIVPATQYDLAPGFSVKLDFENAKRIATVPTNGPPSIINAGGTYYVAYDYLARYIDSKNVKGAKTEVVLRREAPPGSGLEPEDMARCILTFRLPKKKPPAPSKG